MEFTNMQLVAFCKIMLGQPYWYGTTVNRATNDLLSRKSKQYPSHYTNSRMSRYKQDVSKNKVVSDCVGLIK